jgi:hypothetical protein
VITNAVDDPTKVGWQRIRQGDEALRAVPNHLSETDCKIDRVAPIGMFLDAVPLLMYEVTAIRRVDETPSWTRPAQKALSPEPL